MEIGSMKIQGETVTRMKMFKYLGSTVQEDGGAEKEVGKRIQVGWNGWRKMIGVLCDSKVPLEVKGKLHKMIVRPTMLYRMETVAVTKGQEKQMGRAEMNMLRFSMGVTRSDRIRNEEVRKQAKAEKLSDKLNETRLRRLGHVKRQEETHGKASDDNDDWKEEEREVREEVEGLRQGEYGGSWSDRRRC